MKEYTFILIRHLHTRHSKRNMKTSNVNRETKKDDPFERFIDNSCFPSNKIAIVFFFMLVSLHGRYLTDEGLKTMMMYINMVLDIYGQTNYRFPKYARPDLMDNAVEIEDQQPSVKKEEVDLCWEAGEQTTDARIMAR
ncbi:hypothetical protein V8B55DRAFT_1410819 [Mucor lusitanicus]